MTLSTSELTMSVDVGMGTNALIYSTVGATGNTEITGASLELTLLANGYDLTLLGSDGEGRPVLYGSGSNAMLGDGSNEWHSAPSGFGGGATNVSCGCSTRMVNARRRPSGDHARSAGDSVSRVTGAPRPEATSWIQICAGPLSEAR